MTKARTGSGGASLATGLFAVTVFGSAFLIFFVQPMVGKHILPWFGGSPGVWTLCLAFYQVCLFAGYAYAHALAARATPRGQLLVHAVVLLLAVLVLPVLPDADWKPAPGQEPSARILAMLGSNVALPFILLAATGPLLQAWYARLFSGRSPYILYAVSNAGSLVALIGFPVFVEPYLPLSTASRIWSVAFVSCGLLVLGCGSRAMRTKGPIESASGADVDRSHAGAGARPLLWIALSASAVVLLMGVTNDLCLDVASVPFLWILPLAVYLMTFVLCFSAERFHAPLTMLAVFVASCTTLVWLGDARGGSGGAGELAIGLPLQIGLYALLLFGGCMLVHGELYRLRPAPRLLTRYYLCVSGGGALGGLAVGLGAPIVFDGYWELSLGVVACALSFATARWQEPAGPRALRWIVAVCVVILGVGGWVLSDRAQGGLLRPQERNFFGVLRVKDLDPDDPTQHRYVLQSGRIDHGLQFVGFRDRPTGYYGRATGIGLAFASRPAAARSRIGVVGLGVGTLAAYGRSGDVFRFYEIDPDVARIAREDGDFTFLADSAAQIELVLGDARLSLESESEHRTHKRFDILVIDAFSSDSIPVHLLTEEAFHLYKERLRSDGFLAVHISNRHLQLAPLVYALGESAGLRALRVRNNLQPLELSLDSLWVLLTEEQRTLEMLTQRLSRRRDKLGISASATRFGHPSKEALDRAPLWTDDYSNLFSVLRRSPTNSPE